VDPSHRCAGALSKLAERERLLGEDEQFGQQSLLLW
jgi:hypothetical protein